MSALIRGLIQANMELDEEERRPSSHCFLICNLCDTAFYAAEDESWHDIVDCFCGHAQFRVSTNSATKWVAAMPCPLIPKKQHNLLISFEDHNKKAVEKKEKSKDEEKA